jgi:hypothetical protein
MAVAVICNPGDRLPPAQLPAEVTLKQTARAEQPSGAGSLWCVVSATLIFYFTGGDRQQIESWLSEHDYRPEGDVYRRRP